MQNRYAGDVGDFLKLGLLRHLAKPLDAGGAELTIGLNWYLAPDESHNADGKHIAYLHESNRRYRTLRECDRDLIRRLASVVANERSVAALDTCGALPPGSSCFSEMLDPVTGRADRERWHRRALRALAATDIVFADPDNGIRLAARPPKLHKYALMGELAEYASRQQSVIAYHHADRSTDATTQAHRRLAELAEGIGQSPVGAVIGRRGSCRFFLVTAAPVHRDLLERALAAFAERWSPHVDLVAGPVS